MQEKDYRELIGNLRGREEDVKEETVLKAEEKLSDGQKAKLREILSSPDKIKELLSSDKAKDLLKKLGK